MPNQQPLTSAQVGAAVKAFRSEWCPACGAGKYRSLEAFCEDCLRRLPLHLKEGISDRAQFIELFHPALAHIRQNAADPGSGRVPPTSSPPRPETTRREDDAS